MMRGQKAIVGAVILTSCAKMICSCAVHSQSTIMQVSYLFHLNKTKREKQIEKERMKRERKRERESMRDIEREKERG